MCSHPLKLLTSAEATVPCREVTARSADPNKYPRKPRYWDKDIALLDAASRTAKNAYVQVLMHAPGEVTALRSLQARVLSAENELYEAIKAAESRVERQRVQGIMDDFSKAGTKATAYVGGGGYIKRA